MAQQDVDRGMLSLRSLTTGTHRRPNTESRRASSSKRTEYSESPSFTERYIHIATLHLSIARAFVAIARACLSIARPSALIATPLVAIEVPRLLIAPASFAIATNGVAM